MEGIFANQQRPIYRLGQNLCHSAICPKLCLSEYCGPSIYQLQIYSPLTLYKECLQELENVIFSLQTNGPVLVMCDFNAHIGQSYSDRVSGQTNTQGHLLLDLMNYTGHYTVSLSDIAEGPMSTFFSGNRNTTV